VVDILRKREQERRETMSNAYVRMLDRARCTVNFCSPNYLDGRPGMSIDERVVFLIERLRRYHVGGYTAEYIRQLCEGHDAE